MEVGLTEAQISIGYPVAVWIYCYCLCCWSHFAWSVSPMMVYIEYTVHEGVRTAFCFCIYAMVNIKCLSSRIFYSSWWYLNFAYIWAHSRDNPLSWLLGAILYDIFQVVICVGLYSQLVLHLPLSWFNEPIFQEWSFLHGCSTRMSGFTAWKKHYFIELISEAAIIISGLGFSGWSNSSPPRLLRVAQCMKLPPMRGLGEVSIVRSLT